ncbi:penicillin-binding transpeptidase domain-containing protein [Patulibacter sp.]|uniref:penicillin-binding transpeptidase domain-containing protein n=1 Tax=Patulibacter sp. TaxID=1912859 RepID=UPI0027227C7A|nr:penicillin-binding transpeptidase domain-containing protein [Patulibacter sp.]MDO9410209.1 penicillin-binding transpeptidase domain-containing protein [Patulibacter sp.]
MSAHDRRTSTPELALRIAAFGIIAFGIFAVLFLRLWFLQVLQGDQYTQQANENRARVVRIAAPRGTIVDRNGQDGAGTFVDNKLSTVVTLQGDAISQIDVRTINGWGQRRGRHDLAVDRLTERLLAPSSARDERRIRLLSPAARQRRQARATSRATARLRKDRVPDLKVSRDATPALRTTLRNVGRLLDVSTARLYERVVSGVVQVSYAGVALNTKDVSPAVRNYILENPRRYPGITVTKEYFRQFPDGALAAQIFGQVGEIGDEQLKDPKYRGLVQGQRIGQSGLEYEYDSFLRGRDGERRIEVNAANQPTGRVTEVQPKTGDRLRLTLDERLTRVAQRGLQGQIGQRIDVKTGRRAGGAVVAMDPRNGEILAMASYPSVDPGVFNRISANRLRRLTSQKNGEPLFNRAISATYPAGSTFKIVTASAGLMSGQISTSSTQGAGQCLSFGTQSRFCNAGNAEHGNQNVTDALTVSSDTFFYQLGWDLYPRQGSPLQRWARLYGFDRRTGVDLPGEASGTIPDAAWRRSRDVEEKACRKQRKIDNCGLVAELGTPYRQGDNVNLSVGQGDLQMTPLQLATAYSGLYDRDGAVRDDLHFPTPHLGKQVESPTGVLKERFETPTSRRVRFPASYKSAIEQGLHGAVSAPGGTGTGVFRGWDQGRYRVLGKTGTAERCDKSTGTECDQSWFVGMVEDPERPIVVVATVEDGGFGAEAAGPIVCGVMRSWYGQSAKQVPCSGGSGGD